MLRHWRQLAGNLELLKSQMETELERVVGERAIFHGISKTPLRKGKIDSVRAHDCLVIVDEATREVCLVPIAYITQIGDHKLPKLKPLAVIDDREEDPTRIRETLEEALWLMDSYPGGEEFFSDEVRFATAIGMFVEKHRHLLPVEKHRHLLPVEEPREPTEWEKEQLDATRTLSAPTAKITFIDKLGDPPQGKDSPGLLIMDETGDPAAIQEARRRLMKELEVLPDEIKKAYANTPIDGSLFGKILVKGDDVAALYRDNPTDMKAETPLRLAFLLTRLQNAVWERVQERMPDLLVISTDLWPLVDKIEGYEAHDVDPKRHGRRYVGRLTRHRLGVIVDPLHPASHGCLTCMGRMAPEYHARFVVLEGREEDL